jgi:hypothetical protein
VKSLLSTVSSGQARGAEHPGPLHGPQHHGGHLSTHPPHLHCYSGITLPQDLCVSSPEVVFTVVSLQKISRFLPEAIHIYVFPMDFFSGPRSVVDSRVQNNISEARGSGWGVCLIFLTQLDLTVSEGM